jgi:hypothetical protein
MTVAMPAACSSSAPQASLIRRLFDRWLVSLVKGPGMMDAITSRNEHVSPPHILCARSICLIASGNVPHCSPYVALGASLALGSLTSKLAAEGGISASQTRQVSCGQAHRGVSAPLGAGARRRTPSPDKFRAGRVEMRESRTPRLAFAPVRHHPPLSNFPGFLSLCRSPVVADIRSRRGQNWRHVHPGHHH